MGTDPQSDLSSPDVSKGFNGDMDVDGADLVRMLEGIARGIVHTG